ncbi:MAG: hypothetical protein R6V23_15245, partial [Bacteroidales bacterium]
MPGIFSNIYQSSKKYRFIFVLLILGIFGLSLSLVSKLKFEEDITRMLPSDEKIQRVSKVSQKINLMDKLIINISFRDSTISRPQDLIQFADQLNDTLTNYQPEYIKDINYEVSDKLMIDLYDLFFEHLPIFLEESDYEKIDGRIDPQNIENTIKSNFKTLISPASMAMKKYITKDPLHFTPIILDKLNSFQVGD